MLSGVVNVAGFNAARYGMLEQTLVSVVEGVKVQVANKMQRESTRGGSADSIRDANMSVSKVPGERWGYPSRRLRTPPEDGGVREG